MAYPWAGFGSFLFQTNEMPVDGSDTGWNGKPSIARNRSLGSSKDDLQVMAIGSDERSWEARFSPTRFAQIAALVAVPGNSLTDWDRPTPNTHAAMLMNITQLKWEARPCADGSTERVIRARLEFVSQ